MSNRTKLLIGITGAKRSGKDTVANYIVKKYGFHKRSLSEPLKEACKALFGFSENQLNGSSKETPDERWFGITPRETMQFVGTDLLRKQMGKLRTEIGEDVFLHNFRNWYESPDNNRDLVVVPDVRFQNEADYIHSQGGFVIKILYNATADEISLLERIKRFFGIIDAHESEAQHVEYDLTVNNGYTHSFQDLYSQVNSIMKEKLESS